VSLTERHKRQLRRLGHERKPVVMVGAQGLRDAVLAEVDSALEHHELIKVRVAVGDRDARDQAIAAILAATGAELIQRIGHVALLYRHNPERSRITFD